MGGTHEEGAAGTDPRVLARALATLERVVPNVEVHADGVAGEEAALPREDLLVCRQRGQLD